jgi:hypothetical protein
MITDSALKKQAVVLDLVKQFLGKEIDNYPHMEVFDDGSGSTIHETHYITIETVDRFQKFAKANKIGYYFTVKAFNDKLEVYHYFTPKLVEADYPQEIENKEESKA